MIKILITQRIEFTKKHSEFRECLDTRWPTLVEKIGLILIPISSKTKKINFNIEKLNTHGGSIRYFIKRKTPQNLVL